MKTLQLTIITLFFLSTTLFVNGQVKTSMIEKRVDSVLALMTLEEKVGQMNQYNGFWNVTGPAPEGGAAQKKYNDLRKGLVGSMINVRGVDQVRAVQKIVVEESRLGIPLIIGFDAIHGYKTTSPIPLGEAASWDMEAIELSARVTALESAASGINWTFAPMVDISRDARWGRVMEGGGEDPYLGSEIAKARVRGFQGDDLSSVNTIAACAKHFAGYGFSESGKDYNTVDVGTSTLYNAILPPFEAAQKAGVRTFMNSFNDLNGIPATGNSFLLRDILKNTWKYEGVVVSDWGSIGEMIAHGFANDLKHAAEYAALAGCDIDMESSAYVAHLVSLVKEKKVPLALIDDSVKRILTLKFELGLFDDPYRYCDPEREKAVINSEENHQAVLDVAKKSIVLLKNDGNLLPLAKSGQKIALIGPLAADKNSPLGNWRLAADDNTAISVLEGMKEYPKNKLDYAKGVELIVGKTEFISEVNINTSDKSGFEQAINAAKKADKVILVMGEHGYQTGEGRSRAKLDLPGLQQELMQAIYSVNPNIVLVLMNGRPLTIEWAAENIPAIVETWHLGSQSGHAIAQVLYGDYNPSGKLPMCFPRSVGQVPIYYNHKSTGRPTIPAPNLVFWSHYGDEKNSPLYPFGHGLSYTSFLYEDLSISNDYKATAEIKVSVKIKNAGKVKGKEVVQLYLRDKFASVARPVRELKGFKLIELNPGEQKTVEFILGDRELGFYNNHGEWVVETGGFEIYVGGSSAATLQNQFELK
ncbi:MAG: beta-glucosidase BglX [Bacteroidia bacterium]|nr:beta-glucosidase BglX [Bacteroidia bacterium]NNM23001.1 beta-glucosidase BglX [Flavobacteriaceae bacterium]